MDIYCMQKSAGTSERHTIILLFLTLLWEINYVNVAKRSPLLILDGSDIDNVMDYAQKLPRFHWSSVKLLNIRTHCSLSVAMPCNDTIAFHTDKVTIHLFVVTKSYVQHTTFIYVDFAFWRNLLNIVEGHFTHKQNKQTQLSF